MDRHISPRMRVTVVLRRVLTGDDSTVYSSKDQAAVGTRHAHDSVRMGNERAGSDEPLDLAVLGTVQAEVT